MVTKKIFLSIFFLLTIGVYGCNQRPNTNSVEYLKLHGIIEGKENRIKVGDTLVIIPSNVEIQVETYGNIKIGEADVLKLQLDFSNLISGWSDQTSKVRVELRGRSSANESPALDSMASIDTPSGDLNVYGGLIEKPTSEASGGWNFREYIAPLANNYPHIGNIVLKCSGQPKYGISQCWGNYNKGRFNVWFFLSDRLLPEWRQVIIETNETIDSMIRER
ncbi:hypothetical protein ACTXGQ_08475 [Marinobacter sp. 1Y8]